MLSVWLIGVVISAVIHYNLTRTPQGELMLDRLVANKTIKPGHRENFRYAHVFLASIAWPITLPVRLAIKYETNRWFLERKKWTS